MGGSPSVGPRKCVLHIRLSAVDALSFGGSSQSFPVPPMRSLRGCGSVPADCWSSETRCGPGMTASRSLARFDYWVKDVHGWTGRVRRPDGEYVWIKAADLRPMGDE